MKTTTSNPNSVSKLYCNVFGHQYDVSKKVTQHVKEYTCKCCKKQRHRQYFSDPLWKLNIMGDYKVNKFTH